MGSLFRSEEMTLCQLYLQSEAAYNCVSELGELGLVQFRDLNPEVNAFQRKFVNEVRRCDEMERKLRYLETEIKKESVPMLDTGESPDAPAPKEMIDLEATFEKLENELREVNSNTDVLQKNFLELTELKHVLRMTQRFLDSDEDKQEIQQTLEQSTADTAGIIPGRADAQDASHPFKLGFIAGVINRERMMSFERMLWRVCRGNAFLKQVEIETPLDDPHSRDKVIKSVFVIYFQGDRLKSRIKKICEGFHASLYPCPEDPAQRRDMAMGVMTRIEDLTTVLEQTKDHRHRVLVAAAKNIKVWFIKVRKIKAIYHTLNLFNVNVGQECLVAECWCPDRDMERIHQALRTSTERSGSSVPSILQPMETSEQPPTYNRTNKFTSVFQSIIDSYGVASYREVNPAPFTIISFPFLFSVMFGDAGHATIMLAGVLWMVLWEKQLIAKKINDEIWKMLFGGRYIVLLMAVMSVYAGLIYNDVFSKSLNIFGSAFSGRNWNDSKIHTLETITLDPNTSDYRGYPYYFGMDPVWQMSKNKITYQNSYKMKISVIFGVVQMLFGVILSLCNHSYFKKPINMFCEFIPQMIFLLAIFGYLIVLIFYKWLAFDAASSGCAPSLLVGFINMFLLNYPKFPCSALTFYPHQQLVQTALVLLALVCIPWMLLIKPFVLRSQHRRRMRGKPSRGRTSSDTRPILLDEESPATDGTYDEIKGDDIPEPAQTTPKAAAHGHGDDEDEFDMSEVFIHQAIHTIEYCLGCISHTASYLRLWALSLAHVELSEVLWTMVMRNGFQMLPGYAGTVILVIVFAFWAGATVVILLLMEGLSAFLHTIRLHWVEFQSKFYEGLGYAFTPFCFVTILEEEEATPDP